MIFQHVIKLRVGFDSFKSMLHDKTTQNMPLALCQCRNENTVVPQEDNNTIEIHHLFLNKQKKETTKHKNSTHCIAARCSHGRKTEKTELLKVLYRCAKYPRALTTQTLNQFLQYKPSCTSTTLCLSRGRILGRNPDRSLKSFLPCYSQSPLLTDCTEQ